MSYDPDWRPYPVTSRVTPDPDQKVSGAGMGLGFLLMVVGVALIPFFLPVYIIYKVALLTGVAALHPAMVITFAGAAAWGMWKLGGIMIRTIAPGVARFLIALYIGACYTFAFFQRELTTARSELGLTWMFFALAIFTFIGWKVGGALVDRAHSGELGRRLRKEQRHQ